MKGSEGLSNHEHEEPKLSFKEAVKFQHDLIGRYGEKRGAESKPNWGTLYGNAFREIVDCDPASRKCKGPELRALLRSGNEEDIKAAFEEIERSLNYPPEENMEEAA